MCSILQIASMIIGVVWWVVIIQVIMSWLINFQVLNLQQPIVYQIWAGLNRLLAPVYDPIRRILPNMGGIDLSPMVLILGLYALRIVIANNQYAVC